VRRGRDNDARADIAGYRRDTAGEPREMKAGAGRGSPLIERDKGAMSEAPGRARRRNVRRNLEDEDVCDASEGHAS